MEANLEKKRFLYALFFPTVVAVLMSLIFICQISFKQDLFWLGIHPLHVNGLVGILSHTFIHADVVHLLNNLVSFWILSVALFYFYKDIAFRVWLLSWLMSGSLLWVIGRDSWHIGCSDLIYCMAFFLFLSGLLRKHIPLIAISLIVVFVYGGMVWNMLPWMPNMVVSWEGHLAGAVSGIVLAVVFRKQGPQRPPQKEEQEDEEDSEYWKEEDSEDIADSNI
ncbi:MAG: rhomboid family intramembrane serine protease [Sphingobacteriia bacterium]|nr:rhomboid family intramembrane serine protease [Sphingobacteriia bacterium]